MVYNLRTLFFNTGHSFRRSLPVVEVEDLIDYLVYSDFRWQYQTLVVPMHHDKYSDGSCGDGPRVLVCVAFLMCFWILKRDVKHLGEVLAEVMGCGSLEVNENE